MCDFLDPNTWDLTPHQYRMYAGTSANISCLVDEEDYRYFTQWLWKTRRSRTGTKLYFVRTPKGAQITLHIEICRKANGAPLTEKHTIADHLNGNSLDNRRHNLRWATPKQNRRNHRGSYLFQQSLSL